MIWTRASLLAHARATAHQDVDRVLRVYRDATDATYEGEPDHQARLSGARGLSSLWGLDAPKQLEPESAGRPIQVAIVLTHADAGAALPTNGVRLHLSNGDGER